MLGQQLYNVTVDDDNSIIQYSDGWQTFGADVGVGGSYRVTQATNATALVEFQGVAIFLLSPHWPYDVAIQAQLDSQPPYIIQLMEPEPLAKLDGSQEPGRSRIAWSWEGLDNRVHQLRIGAVPFSKLTVVDGFIITHVNESTSHSSSSSTTAVKTASAVQSDQSTLEPISFHHQSVRNALAIGVGIGVALVALAASLSSFIYIRWKRRGRLAGPSRGTLKVDLENDFHPLPKPRALSSLYAQSSPGSIAALSPRQRPPGTSNTLESTSQIRCPPTARLTYLLNHRTTLDYPPPGYYDCVGPNLKQAWENCTTSKISASTDCASRSSPPTSNPSITGNHLYYVKHEHPLL